METNDKHIAIRKWSARFVFGTILLILFYRYFTGSLVHQWQEPVLMRPHLDLSYWAVLSTGFFEFLFRFPLAAWFFDLGLFTTALASLVYWNNKWFPRVFLGLFFVYLVGYNAFSGHHTHSILGVLFIVVPFCFSRLGSFLLLWEGVRYYTLFIYFSAFLWKLFRGSVFHLQQGIAVVESNLASFLYYEPNHWLVPIYQKILLYPDSVSVFYLVAMLLEGAMLIGFFTKKWDWALFFLPILFHTGSYFLVDVAFFEILILLYSFLNWEKIIGIFEDRRQVA